MDDFRKNFNDTSERVGLNLNEVRIVLIIY